MMWLNKRSAIGLLLAIGSGVLLFPSREFEWIHLTYLGAVSGAMSGRLSAEYFLILSVFCASVAGVLIRVLSGGLFRKNPQSAQRVRVLPTGTQNVPVARAPARPNALEQHIGDMRR